MQIQIPHLAQFKRSEESTPVSGNPAVARCCNAGSRAYRTVLAKQNSRTEASRAAGDAYRLAMPPLSGDENIRDFVACVAHGILMGAIPSDVAMRLLHAAKVAGGLLKNKRPKLNSPAARD